jgi:hypothetical protein
LRDKDDVCIFAGAVLQACRRFCHLMLFLGQHDCSWDMAEVLVLENTEKAHGRYGSFKMVLSLN